MFEDKRILAIIPARGGSKGLPGKNIRKLAGKPLIVWTIAAAQKSRYLDELTVSTDDPEIAKVAGEAGARIPFTRPAELAGDRANIMDSIFHAIDWLQKNGEVFDLVILLQPTSPLRSSQDIDTAIENYFSQKADVIVAVCETDHHPWWSNCLPEDGSMEHFLKPETLNIVNRQELPIFYRVNGAIYLADIKKLVKTGTFYGPTTFAYIMPKERSVDIDSPLDFHLAEAILKSTPDN